jgi:uncharacterized cupin superfamily protein
VRDATRNAVQRRAAPLNPPTDRVGRTLPSHRHWHEAKHKFIYVLSGVLVLVEDGETTLGPRDAAGLPAAHSLENRSADTAIYLVVGTRAGRA